jgi:hypothetical protein
MKTLDKAAVPLGLTVKDTITGFTGIVTGYVQYLTGCNQALVAPKVGKDGRPLDPHWFDEQRLAIDPRKKAIVLDNGNHPGADLAAPIR